MQISIGKLSRTQEWYEKKKNETNKLIQEHRIIEKLNYPKLKVVRSGVTIKFTHSQIEYLSKLLYSN